MKNRNLNVTLDGIVFGLQNFGGISNYWGRLVRHMDSLQTVDSHLVIPKKIRCSEYDAIWHSKSTFTNEVISTAFSRYLDVSIDQKCDIFHSSYYRIPKFKSTRYVVTVYDFIYERYGEGFARRVHTWQKLRSIRRADAVICISHATRDDVLRCVPDVDPSRVHVVYLGVDQSVFFPEQTVHVSDIKNTVLYVGQRVAHKRFDLAVEAIAQCSELSLGIVGPPISSYEAEMLESRLHGRWHSFGPVTSSRLRELYSTAFAFICPSDYEGFGLPILEAMACGCPVVVANNSSLPEVGGQAALYAHKQSPEFFAEALTQLYNSEKDRKLAIEAGLRHVLDFSWDSTFKETLAIYQSALVGVCRD
jgi:mannosyltransferase